MLIKYIQRLIDDVLDGRTFMEFLIKYLKMFGILVFIFYYTYPQALGVFGRSFIVPTAALGGLLYAYHRFPFVEMHKALFAFFIFIFWVYFTETVNGVGESFMMTYVRSQMGWFFSAYLLNILLFKVHKKPSFEVIVGYIAGAIILQCIITFAMYLNEDIKEFFQSYQMEGGEFDEEKMEIIEAQRLMGYGTALFGAGLVAGYGLIFIAYLVSKLQLTKIQFVAFGIAYIYVFFIGLFSARTTIIGLVCSILFVCALYFLDRKTQRGQVVYFAGLAAVLMSVGAGLAVYYFPDFTGWAFELFDNYREKGSLSTSSSDALYSMFYLPDTAWEILTGTSKGLVFWGNDMGMTRLIFGVGVFGLILYFGYQFVLTQLCMTKDLTANLLVLSVLAYSLVMNIKGFTDMNPTLYLFVIFFAFYKNHVYYPDLYLKLMIEKGKMLDEQQLNRE